MIGLISSYGGRVPKVWNKNKTLQFLFLNKFVNKDCNDIYIY